MHIRPLTSRYWFRTGFVTRCYSSKRPNGTAAVIQHRGRSDPEASRLSPLRLRKLRKRLPPFDPALCYKDYSAAERAKALRIFGRPESGGGYLCMACLGPEDGAVPDDADVVVMGEESLTLTPPPSHDIRPACGSVYISRAMVAYRALKL
ncbi:hypothetical protein BJ546DRAFT_671306 [Cryomyces antarcticus]